MAKFLFYVVLSGEGDNMDEAWSDMTQNLTLENDPPPELVHNDPLTVMKALDEVQGAAVEVEDEDDDSRDAYGDRNLEIQGD